MFASNMSPKNKKFDWKLTIALNILKLKIVGLWPPGKTYEPNLYTLWSTFCISIFTFGHNFFQTINIIFIFPDLEAIAASTFVTLPELLGLMKVYCVMMNMGSLKRIMKSLDSDMFQPKNVQQVSLIEPSLKRWKTVYALYWTASLSAIFFWSIYPIMDGSYRQHRLPFLAWYPYNDKISPYYQITYIHQILGTCFIATTAISTDTLISALNVYIGAQFDILADNIRHYLYTGKKEEFKTQFIECVKHHRGILKFAEDCEKFANWIVLGQFFISAVSIGITMFQLTSVIPFSSEFFSLLSFLSSITVEIFMFCWFGNEVETKSKQLLSALYESNWINTSTKLKRAMTILMLKCQKPCKMSSLNLFYLSLDTFTKILRAAWSYFALLHQLSSRR